MGVSSGSCPFIVPGYNELLELNDAQGNDIGAVNVERYDHQGIEAGLDIELLKSVFVEEKKKSRRANVQSNLHAERFSFRGLFDLWPQPDRGNTRAIL